MLLRSPCACCGRPPAAICSECAAGLVAAPALAAPAWLDRCDALYEYEAARPLVTSLKNGNARSLVPWLAEQMTARWAPPDGAVVTWAPTSGARRRARGFDQAELLARAVARRWGVPQARLLRRAPGPAQAGRGRRDRLVNPVLAPVGTAPASVVVVDDVVTSGATMSAAARALRTAGAARVTGLAIARAPIRWAA